MSNSISGRYVAPYHHFCCIPQWYGNPTGKWGKNNRGACFSRSVCWNLTAFSSYYYCEYQAFFSFRQMVPQRLNLNASYYTVLPCQVYFINHRYDGIQLWQVQGISGIHELVWLSSFISFFFLYPSTFNLLEVAAVDKPKLHMWETGIMRITRHPQVDYSL